MKKRILILLLAILTLLLAFTACKKKNKVVAQSIEVVSGSVATEFNVGDTPNFSGIKVKVTYSNNTTAEIGYSDVQISAVDTSKAGEKTVTVTYGELKTQFKVTVKAEEKVEATLASIKIVPGTVPTALYKGQVFDVSGLQVEAIYSDNTKKVLSYSDVEATAIDTTTAGDKIFSVTYQGKTDSITVKVHDITSVKVVTGSIASKLFVGETLDTSKVEVLVTYGDGKSVVIPATGLTVGTLDTTTYGDKTVSITYNGITIQHAVEVVGERSITVLPGSVPTSIRVGQTYDASKIQVTLSYSGTSTDPKVLSASDVTVSAIDTSTAGDKTLKVTYKGLETTVTVKVIGVDTLDVVTNTVKSEILKGETLDTSAIQVGVKYTDGTTEVVGASALTLGTINKDTAGEQKLTIKYLDKTIEYTVKVCDVTSIEISGVDDKVQSGTEVDLSKLKVYVVYNDSRKTRIEVTGETGATITTSIHPSDKNSIENRVLTVTYSGGYGEFTTQYPITATAAALVDIEIEYKTEVLLNGAYGKNNVVVKAVYANTHKEQVVDFEMTPVDTTTPGEKVFKVTYEKNNVKYEKEGKVQVCTVTGLSIAGVDNYLPVGAELDLGKMQVYGVYNTTSPTLTAQPLKGTWTTNAADIVIENEDDTATLIVTYTDSIYGTITGEFTIYGKPPVLEGLDIQVNDPEVLVGIDTFDKSNITVYAVYSNGPVPVPLLKEAFEMDPVSTSEAGTVTFYVYYNGVSQSAQVKVCGITDIVVENVPTSVKYGETINLENMVVYGVYDTTIPTTIATPLPADKITITTNGDIDYREEGTKTLTVTYYDAAYGSGKRDVHFNVEPAAFIGIEIGAWDDGIGVGMEYDTSTVIVYATKESGRGGRLDENLTYEISTNIVGETVLKVTYTDENNEKWTAEKPVTVYDIASLTVSGIATEVDQDGTLDTTRVTVLVMFLNGDTTTVGIANGVTVGNPDTSSYGDKELTVTYRDKHAQHKYHVKGVKRIEIYSGLPYVVREGKTIDDSNLQIRIVYSNDTAIIESAEKLGISGTTTDIDNGTRYTISYKGKSVSRDLVKAALYQIHALNGTIPGTIVSGTTLDYDSFRVTFAYRYVVKVVQPKLDENGKEMEDESGNVIMEPVMVEVKDENGNPVKDEHGNPVKVQKEETREDVFLVKVGEEDGEYGLYYVLPAGDPNIKGSTWAPLAIPYGYVPNINTTLLGENDNGERVVQFVYLPTGTEADYDMTTGMPIPKYQAQAKIIVIDVASIMIVPGSLPSNVKLNGQYDLTGMQVQVTYTDGTYKYIGINDGHGLEIVESIDTAVAGQQTLKVKLGDAEATYDVTVVDAGADVGGGVIFGAMLPDSLIARKTYKENFKDSDNIYVVGNDNPYVLYLNVAVLDRNNDLVDVDGKIYPTQVEISEITSGTEVALSGTAGENGNVIFTDSEGKHIVTFNGVNHTYQFTDEAINREFRLVICPAAAPHYKAEPHDIKVVDGYNVYNEIELNLITNSTGFETNENLHENLTLSRLDQADVVEKFLRNYFVEKLAEELDIPVERITAEQAEAAFVNPNSINAIILHRNMSIKQEHLPAEYFHTYTKDGVTKTELIDMLEIYQRLVPSGRPFTFYGNYYSVFSYELPCVVPKNVWNNIDDYSNSTLFSFRLDINGYWALVNNMNDPEINWPSDEQIANIQDVSFRDNDPNSNDQSANDRHMRGLTCITNKGVTTNATNVNVEAFVVAMRAEGINCTINLDQVKFYNCWQGQIFVWNDNGFQLDKWNGPNTPTGDTLPGLFGTKIYITDSLLAKCGGPVILAQSNRSKEAANNELGVDVVVDDKSVLYSYVTGQEAWFVAVNQTPMAGQIVALDALLKSTAADQEINASYLSDEKISGVKTMNMVMVVMGAGIAPGEQYSGSFARGYKNENGEWIKNEDGELIVDYQMQMIKDASDRNPGPNPDTMPGMYDLYMSIPQISQAPIFQTSAGATFYGDPYGVSDGNGGYANVGTHVLKPGCYTVAEIPQPATGTAFQGDYITMYMYGMGIMLEYYND